LQNKLEVTVARADLLLDLVEAGQRRDQGRFTAVVEALIAEERANQHHVLADRLSAVVTTTGEEPQRDEHARSVADLVADLIPERTLAELYLSADNRLEVRTVGRRRVTQSKRRPRLCLIRAPSRRSV
jgi:hypothetical protein